jgi:hypothetical protein
MMRRRETTSEWNAREHGRSTSLTDTVRRAETFRIRGLIAAPPQAFGPNGELRLDTIPTQARLLHESGVHAVCVRVESSAHRRFFAAHSLACRFAVGSTGEGPALSVSERKQVAAAWRQVRHSFGHPTGFSCVERCRRRANSACCALCTSAAACSATCRSLQAMPRCDTAGRLAVAALRGVLGSTGDWRRRSGHHCPVLLQAGVHSVARGLARCVCVCVCVCAAATRGALECSLVLCMCCSQCGWSVLQDAFLLLPHPVHDQCGVQHVQLD